MLLLGRARCLQDSLGGAATAEDAHLGLLALWPREWRRGRYLIAKAPRREQGDSRPAGLFLDPHQGGTF